MMDPTRPLGHHAIRCRTLVPDWICILMQPLSFLFGPSLRYAVSFAASHDPVPPVPRMTRLRIDEQAVAQISPRSQTIDGSSPGSAGVLLGTVKKDSVVGGHLSEAGPLTLADHGVCCIQHLERLTVHHAVSSIFPTTGRTTLM